MNENPYKAPKINDRPVAGTPVAVEISPSWVRRLNSRWFLLIAALTGVSISFCRWPFGPIRKLRFCGD